MVIGRDAGACQGVTLQAQQVLPPHGAQAAEGLRGMRVERLSLAPPDPWYHGSEAWRPLAPAAPTRRQVRTDEDPTRRHHKILY